MASLASYDVDSLQEISLQKIRLRKIGPQQTGVVAADLPHHLMRADDCSQRTLQFMGEHRHELVLMPARLRRQVTCSPQLPARRSELCQRAHHALVLSIEIPFRAIGYDPDCPNRLAMVMKRV